MIIETPTKYGECDRCKCSVPERKHIVSTRRKYDYNVCYQCAKIIIKRIKIENNEEDMALCGIERLLSLAIGIKQRVCTSPSKSTRFHRVVSWFHDVLFSN